MNTFWDSTGIPNSEAMQLGITMAVNDFKRRKSNKNLTLFDTHYCLDLGKKFRVENCSAGQS